MPALPRGLGAGGLGLAIGFVPGFAAAVWPQPDNTDPYPGHDEGQTGVCHIHTGMVVASKR